jgi:hypothetical protein
MDVKTLFGLTVIPAGIVGGIVMACLSSRIRDLFFLLLVFLSPFIERLDLNYVSREWYRGTSRGFEVSVLDILAISILVSSMLFPRRDEVRGFWPASFGLMLLFFCYAAFNVAISEPRLFGLFELFRMARGFVLVLAVAFYVRTEREVRLFLGAMVMLIAYEALLSIKQRYLGGVHRVYGTLDESNSLSGFLCMTSPLLVAGLNSRVPKWVKVLCALAIPLACVGEILTISRAGLITIGLVLLGTTLTTISLRITPRKVACAMVIVVGAAGMLAKSWKTLSTRFHESNFKEEYESKKNLGRGYYLRIAKTIAGERPFGVGLNNWSYWASNKYGPKLGYPFVPYKGTDREPSDKIPENSNLDEAQAAPAHNLSALTVGELGIPGLALFLLLWLRWFQMGATFLRRRTASPLRRIPIGIFFGFCGMFLQCLTEWFYRHLPLYYVFHIMLGVLMSLYWIRRRELRAAAAPAETEPDYLPAPALATSA